MSEGISIGIFLATLLLNSAVACLFLYFLPSDLPREQKVSVHYFRGYFITSCLTYLSFGSREYVDFLFSVFTTNVLILATPYCVLFGVYWRYGMHRHPHTHPAALHIFLFASIQTLLAAYYPSYDLARLLMVYVNVTAVFLFVLSLFYRFVGRREHNERILSLCLAVATFSILSLPITYFATNDPSIFLGVSLLIQNTLTMLLFGAFYSSFLFDEIYRHQENAITDPLTGLYNRRFFFEQGAKFMKSAERHHFPVSLIICDLDHFKQINDSHGHGAGDQVIVSFARALQRITRQEDLVARYGGEEFVAMLPQTSPDGARLIAERLRAETEHTPVQVNGETISFTASFGVSGLQKYANIESCIQAADRALYRAKTSGRNQVASEKLDTLSQQDREC